VERHPARQGIAEREHQPVGGGVEDQPELVGGRALAGGAVGGELDLVLLDEGLGLAAGAVDPFVEMAGLAGERSDYVARVEAARRRLEPGDDAAFAVPRAGGVIEAGEAAHLLRAGLGAAHLEIVGDIVGEAVQNGIARQAEDVVDAVFLAPRHGLGSAVVAVSAEGQPGARPVSADAAHRVLQQGADLGTRRRLAGAQEHRYRLAALDMVDMRRQGAPRVVEGVEQRELLMPVHRVAGVVDFEHDRRQCVDHPLRVASLPDAAGQRLGQPEPALRRAQQDQAAVGRDRTAREIGGHLLAAYGWKIERENHIFGHGGVALSLLRWKDAGKRIST